LNLPSSESCVFHGLLINYTGIGRAAALLLARKGGRIAINDLDPAKARAVVEELTSAGYEADSFPGDVLAADFSARVVEDVLARFGKINCLINNAGSNVYTMTAATCSITDQTLMGRLLF
jgi:NAD(P)-dependent dehydrogenase (short-subunit alcohol dehydrogenase family)